MATTNSSGVGLRPGPKFISPNTSYNPIGFPISYNASSESASTVWFSISLVQNRECAGGFKFSRAVCENVFRTILESCNANSTEKFGSSIVDGCGIYEMMTLKSKIPPKGDYEWFLDTTLTSNYSGMSSWIGV